MLSDFKKVYMATYVYVSMEWKIESHAYYPPGPKIQI